MNNNLRSRLKKSIYQPVVRISLVLCLLLVPVIVVHAYVSPGSLESDPSVQTAETNLIPSQAPVALNDGGEGFTTDEDSAFITGNVLANDSHPDGAPLIVQGLDTTGTIGMVTPADGSLNFFTATNYGGLEGSHDIAIQPDGKILAAGYAYNGENHYDFALIRYNPDGSFDPTFDGDGLVTTDFGAVEKGYALALQTDGNILVAGHAYSNTINTDSIALVRYLPDGSLDTTFDADGKASFAVGLGDMGNYGIALQDDGKIVVVGTGYDNAYRIIVARFNSDGSLDFSFDDDGIVLSGVFNYTLGKDIVIQPDQKILVSGHYADVTTGGGFVLARFLPDGSLDPSFDEDGLVTAYAPSSTSGLGQAIALQPDGKILSTGFDDNDIVVVRYNPDGSPDPNFDEDGIVFTDFGPSDLSNDVALLPSGKILVVGRGTDDDHNFDILLVRYNPDGSLDHTFGGDGTVVADASEDVDSANALALEEKGGIVIAGGVPSGSVLAGFSVSGTFSYDPQGQFEHLDAGELAYDYFSYIVSDGVLTDTATVTLTVNGATDTSYAFLPLLINFSPIPINPGISGQITFNGSPLGGVSLELRFYDGSNWSTRATTTTAADGKYIFTNIPSLASGQIYYVLYKNQTDPSRLYVWGTPELTGYDEGELVTVESFDIANLELVSPSSGASVGIPVTFQWVPRPASPTDNYEFNLYEEGEDDPYFYTDPPLGYVSAYTLSQLPPGFNTGTEYLWDIWMYSPQGGFGISYWSYFVTFTHTASMQTEYVPAAAFWRGKDPASLIERHR